jgi:hypothetical protein
MSHRNNALVGSWHVAVTSTQMPPVNSFGTFGADGTLVTSPPPVLPRPGASGEIVFTSSGHGAWTATGPDAAILTFVGQSVDGKGIPVGTMTVRASLVLSADGKAFSGEGARTFASPAGNVLATDKIVVQAARIAAEAPEATGATATPA